MPAEKESLCPPPFGPLSGTAPSGARGGEEGVRQPAEGPSDDGERGSAVVDFVFVSVLILVLLLAVLQVAVYVHLRNVVTASAQEGARFAANADVDSAVGAARAVEIVARATSERTANGLTCTSTEEPDPSGPAVVVVRCSGSVPTLLSWLGDVLPLTATGRALKEAA